MNIMITRRLIMLAVGAMVALAAAGAAAEQSSWIFRHGTYTHDPMTGARVAQYAPTPPVEPLPDQRLVTSSYRFTRTNIRGTDGSLDSGYQVRAWSNLPGGLDAEWERFHDAWKESYLSGGYYYQGGYGPYGYGNGGGYRGYPGWNYGQPGYGYGNGGYGGPGYHYPPARGGPGYPGGWPPQN